MEYSVAQKRIRRMTRVLTLPGDGERIVWQEQGHVFRLKVAPESGGSFSLTEATIPPGKGAGLHIHEQSEECWYVLEGEYRFTVGGEEFTAGPGATVVVPRGVPHGLVAGDSGGRHLTIFAPAGCETAFREIGAAQQRGETNPDFWRQLGIRTHTQFSVRNRSESDHGG
jgi:mannose-6-phosphate isomerase-like protein (cupin superfamily)